MKSSSSSSSDSVSVCDSLLCRVPGLESLPVSSSSSDGGSWDVDMYLS